MSVHGNGRPDGDHGPEDDDERLPHRDAGSGAGRAPEKPSGRPRRGSRLRTAGELVEGGGWAGSLATLVYVVIGLGFWSLVGWGADRLLGTQWIVVLGACVGAASGVYVVYLHMQEGLRRGPPSDGADPDDPHQSGPDSAPRP